MKYLFIGNRLVNRPDMWLSITHTGPRPPQTMTIVAEFYASMDPREEPQVEERHLYHRQTIGRRQRGEEAQERYVYLHESIGGASDPSIPLSNELAQALWDEIVEKENQK